MDNAWQVAAAVDVNGDGKADLPWRHADGSVALWLMDGLGALATGSLYNPRAGWANLGCPAADILTSAAGDRARRPARRASGVAAAHRKTSHAGQPECRPA